MDEFKRELEDYFCRFTFGQFVTLILLEIVTLFFVFYLGARYGQDLIGGRAVAQREESLPKDSPKSVDDIVGTPPVEYTYPEVLTGSKSSADGKGIKVKPSGMTAEEYERLGRKTASSESTGKETIIKGGEEGTEIPPIGEIPSGQLARSGSVSGKYAIQVGSYQSEQEASAAASRWKQKGYSSFMTVGEVPEKGIWYRVRIGGFDDRQEAETFLERFKSKEKASGLVVLSRS